MVVVVFEWSFFVALLLSARFPASGLVSSYYIPEGLVVVWFSADAPSRGTAGSFGLGSTIVASWVVVPVLVS